MIYVIDTSVAVKWFVTEAAHHEALTFLSREKELAAPDFAIAEVANVLWRKERLGEISGDQVSDAMARMPRFFQHLLPAAELITPALILARLLSHSVYDCLFLACAQRLREAVLVTSDKRFSDKLITADLGNLVHFLAEASNRESN